eukprot:CAMPEP_0175903474 /NCGR_PEP_ID=MMETSP0108-20121206/3957_1 /TAXON_ID=195067 ORGANISM="Goniomonas pacifica, Strain CCMP1869" /NCGR_SAMPLE_ID=MMETSP0108 /ASSEMBLY_ACC=CAM_ASM_000204 /LENGTH=174 /DNA_ID=CAMNT_0017225211 /DNA_START=567 /DNA_END=1091 /DNA_ORIENTATION=+
MACVAKPRDLIRRSSPGWPTPTPRTYSYGPSPLSPTSLTLSPLRLHRRQSSSRLSSLRLQPEVPQHHAPAHCTTVCATNPALHLSPGHCACPQYIGGCAALDLDASGSISGFHLPRTTFTPVNHVARRDSGSACGGGGGTGTVRTHSWDVTVQDCAVRLQIPGTAGNRTSMTKA